MKSVYLDDHKICGHDFREKAAIAGKLYQKDTSSKGNTMTREHKTAVR